LGGNFAVEAPEKSQDRYGHVKLIRGQAQHGPCVVESAARLEAENLPKMREAMKFTPKIKGGPIACGILTMAAMGWSGPVNYVAAAPVSIVAMQDTFAGQESFQTNNGVAVMPEVESIPPSNAEGATANVIPVTHWYDNKHWWKRNAPIIGGAAGGALIGGLAGGGKGLLIGGAVGGGGGALYKHYHHHHYHQGTASRTGSPTQYQTHR
jgi:hypothetical protein